jgi:integrase
MLVGGVPTKVVQEILGHADAAMTLNVYSHVLPNMQDEAARRIDSILS